MGATRNRGVEYRYLKSMSKVSRALTLINIPTFFHMRVVSGSKFFILSNNRKLLDLFAQEDNAVGDFIENSLHSFSQGKLSVHLWLESSRENFIHQLAKHDIAHGVSLVLYLDNRLDIFSFASSKEREEMRNFYLNHVRLLKRFIVYYKNQAKKILLAMEQHYRTGTGLDVLLEQKSQKDKHIATYQLKSALRPHQLIIKNKLNAIIQLTIKETLYLQHYLEGKSVRQIAEQLYVSPRTIESCLENLKYKTGCYSKHELLSLLFENTLNHSEFIL